MKTLCAALLLAASLIGASPVLAELENYMCYRVKPSAGAERFGKTEATQRVYVALDDSLALANPQGLDPNAIPGTPGTYQAKKVTEICLPASVDGHPAGGDGAMRVMYQLRSQRGHCADDPAVGCRRDVHCAPDGSVGCVAIPRFQNREPRNQSVRVVDAHVDLRLDFSREAMALLPASGVPAALGDWIGVPESGDVLKCYFVKPTRASCVGGAHAGEGCRRDGDCPDGVCGLNLKFPRRTHPEGLAVHVGDGLSELFDPDDPGRPVDLKRVRMFCQSADAKLGADPVQTVARSEPAAGLLCYVGRSGRAACDGGPQDKRPCRRDSDCPDGSCRPEPRFDKRDPSVAGVFVEDALFQHRFDGVREGLFCSEACRGVDDFVLNDLLLHVTHLAVGPQGAAPALAGLERGVDVDANSGTHAPQSESADGLDNQLMGLGSILNGLLQEQIDRGGLTFLLQAEQFTDGTVTLNGFPGNLAADPGCTAGGDPDPLDPGDPDDPCRYTANASAFVVDIGGSCRTRPPFSLDLNVSGTQIEPPGVVEGTSDGPGRELTLALPLAGQELSLVIREVGARAEFVHDGATISEVRGVIGGGLNHADLVDAVAALPNTCDGGSNDSAVCLDDGDCPDAACVLAPPFTAQALANFIHDTFPPDLDLDPDLDGDHPGADAANESVSIGLLFRATRAIGAGLD